MQPILFSVIVPSYNYAQYLPRCIASIMQQDYPEVEAIIIDDGSTDATATIVPELLAKYPGKLRYYRQENQGVAVARNLGISHAKGQYLILLDADDTIVPHALTVYLDYLQRMPEIDFFLAQHETELPNGKIKSAKASQLAKEKSQNFIDYLLKRKISMANGAILIKNSVFKELLYPAHLRRAEDLVFNALMLANFQGVTINQPLMTVYKHAGSLRQESSEYAATLVSIVDEIFNANLPSELLKYRQDFLIRRKLSLFRILYLAKDYKKAKQVFHEAFKLRPSIIWQWSYLRKYLALQLRNLSPKQLINKAGENK